MKEKNAIFDKVFLKIIYQLLNSLKMNILQKFLLAVGVSFSLTVILLIFVFKIYFKQNQENTIENSIQTKQRELSNNVNRISNKAISLAAFYSALKTIKRGLSVYEKNNNLDSSRSIISNKYIALLKDFERNTGSRVEMAFYSFDGINIWRSWADLYGDSIASNSSILKKVFHDKKSAKGLESDLWGVAIHGFSPVYSIDSVFLGVVQVRYPLEMLVSNTILTDHESMSFLLNKNIYDGFSYVNKIGLKLNDLILYLPTKTFDFSRTKLAFANDNSVLNKFFISEKDLYIPLALIDFSNNEIGYLLYQINISKFISNANQVDITVFLTGGIALIFVVLLLIFIGRKIIKYPVAKIVKSILRLSKGKISKGFKVNNNDEIGEINKALNVLNDRFRELTLFSKEIGNGNYDMDFDKLSDEDELGNALIEMRLKLKESQQKEIQRKKDEENRNWANRGYVIFADLLSKNYDSMTEFSNVIITKLVSYLNINQGGLYLYDKDERVFVQKAAYAYNKRKYKEKSIPFGEGLIGTCAIEKESIFLTDIPDNYINITSGLGTANPKSLLLVPLIINNIVYGVIELASFKVFKDFEIEFVEKVSQSIANTINTVQIGIKTTGLLQQSQEQAEELAAQEEELRQNMEELQATYEANNPDEEL